MNVIFRSKDFNSITTAGLGFTNRRPGAASWQYIGRVQHARWEGSYECHWETPTEGSREPGQLLWTVSGDERLFGLAAALKSRGFRVTVEQN